MQRPDALTPIRSVELFDRISGTIWRAARLGTHGPRARSMTCFKS